MKNNQIETLRANKNLKGLEDEDSTLRASNLKGKLFNGLNLQLFAEGGEGAEGGNPEGNPEGGEPNPNPNPEGEGSEGDDLELPSSIEELKMLLESYSDTKVTKAVKTREEKLKEQARKEREEAVKKALARQKMTEEERIQAEYQDKLEEAEKIKAEYERKNLYTDTIRELSKRNLPIALEGEEADSDMATILMGDDLESTIINVEVFEKIFNKAVQKQVKLQLSNPNTPRKGTSKLETGQDEKINRAEMAKKRSIR